MKNVKEVNYWRQYRTVLSNQLKELQKQKSKSRTVTRQLDKLETAIDEASSNISRLERQK